jgi:hypothetical protein
VELLGSAGANEEGSILVKIQETITKTLEKRLK